MKNTLNKIKTTLDSEGGFFKAVSVLVGGTALSQFIAICSLPILTRLYSPTEYSALGVYIAIVSILSSVVCLRLDIAIPVADNEKDAISLLKLALYSSLLLSIVIFIMLYGFYPYLLEILSVSELGYIVWFIPIGVFLTGAYSSVQYWSVRKKKFSDISYSRISQTLSNNGVSLVFGFFSGDKIGLVLGQLMSFGGGILKLAHTALKDISSTSGTRLKDTLWKYRNYPKFSTFEALANVSAIQLPILVIGMYYVGDEVGYMIMAMKILSIPMGLIGSSLSQVYIANAADKLSENKLYEYTISILKKIIKLSFPPFFLLLLLSPYIFGYVLGDKWAGMGIYVMAMIPWFFMQIVSSPVSMSLHLLKKQKIALLLQVFGFFIRVVILCLMILLTRNNYIIWYYIFSGFLFYLIYMLVVLYSIKNARGLECT